MNESEMISTTQPAQDDAVTEAVPKYKPADNVPVEGLRYTYSDYCAWNDDVRYELIDGVPYAMSAPSWQHQEISIELSRQFANFLYDKPCKVFAAPFDVRLNADDADDIVVQPDIVIICDMSGRTKAGYNGSPDMVIEILSPGNAEHDKVKKLKLYEKYGIREYWIVDPETQRVTVCMLNDGKYIMKPYKAADKVPAGIFEDCVIDLADIIEEQQLIG